MSRPNAFAAAAALALLAALLLPVGSVARAQQADSSGNASSNAALEATRVSTPRADTTYHVYVAAESEDKVYHVRFDGEKAAVAEAIPVGQWPTETEGPHGPSPWRPAARTGTSPSRTGSPTGAW